jgi:hypothetical protein
MVHLLLLRVEAQGRRVDTKTHAGRLVRRVVKYVAQVAAAVGALYLHAVHTMGVIFN